MKKGTLRSNLLYLVIIGLMCPTLTWGQSQALYNLGSAIPQNARFNPAFIPEGSFVLGLPGISGVSAGMNAETNYNAIVSENEDGEDFFDFDRIVENTDENSYFHGNAYVSDLYLGFRVRDAFISLFINERANLDAHLPKSLLEVTFQGSDVFENRFFNLDKLGLDAKYFREYGIGYAKQMSDLMTFGVRLKMLQGIYVGRTDRDAEARVRQPDDNVPILDFQFRNAIFDTSGQEFLEDGDVGKIISNSSKGAALDLGLVYNMTRSASFAIGLNDLGFISWKEAPENFRLQDSTFPWAGVGETPEFEDFDDLIQDSLYVNINREETLENFTTGVNARSYISMLFSPTYQDQINVTMASRFVLGRVQTSLGAGYTHTFGKIFTIGANASLRSQQGFDVGSAMALNAGPLQIYTAYDNLLSIRKPKELEHVQVSFGMNFIFGRTLKKSKDPRQEIIDRNNEAYPDYPATKGTYTPVIRQDGIYQVIKEQKEPTPRRLTPSGKEGRDTGYMPIYKRPKKKNRGDFNKASDLRGTERLWFWKKWFNKN